MSGIFNTGNNYFTLHDIDQVTVLYLSATPVKQRYQERQREYNEIMQHLEEKAPPYVAFDFSDCDFIDSVTIGMLVQVTYRVRMKNGNAVLVNMSENIREVFTKLMMLETRTAVWSRYETLTDAIRSLPW